MKTRCMMIYLENKRIQHIGGSLMPYPNAGDSEEVQINVRNQDVLLSPGSGLSKPHSSLEYSYLLRAQTREIIISNIKI